MTSERDHPHWPVTPYVAVPERPDDFLVAGGVRIDDPAGRARRWLAATQIGERNLQDIAQRFADAPPFGRTWVYGTGTFSQELARLCRNQPEVALSGFLDRNADAIGNWEGLPVIAPEALTRDMADTVMVGHATDEPKMIAALHAAGIPDSAIWRGLTHPSVLRRQADAALAEARVRWPLGVDACIISTLGRPWSVIPTATLARLLDGRSLAHLTMGSDVFGASHRLDAVPTLHCGRSALMLAESLAQLKPGLIYLRCSPHSQSEPYVCLVRAALPEATLIVEMNDWTPLFGWDFLHGSLGLDDIGWRAARAGVYQACQEADLVICKNGGPAWDRLAAQFTAPCHLYFPNLDPAEIDAAPPMPAPAAPGSPKRLMFAGSIDPRELDDSPHVQGCQFLWAFRPLSAMPDIRLDVFNSGHPVASVSPPVLRLQAAITALGETHGRLVYHPMTEWAEIMAAPGRFDLALACTHRAGDRVEAVTTVGIGNKFAGYVNAGIPAIIDENYVFAASLIREFGAGVVIPPGDVEALTGMVRDVDLAACRAGIRRLRHHMLTHNAKVLGLLAEAVR